MRMMLTILSAGLLTAYALAVPAVTAQTGQPQAPAAPAAPGAPAPDAAEKGKAIEGTVKSVDKARKAVTLEDGTKLVIPDAVKVDRAQLKPGTSIKANYEERNGQKVVTFLKVAPQL